MIHDKLSRFLEFCVTQLFPGPFDFEEYLASLGFRYVVGIDEVGVGAFFGPILAAAVVFDLRSKKTLRGLLSRLKDSKQLSEKKREEFFTEVCNHAVLVGLGEVGVDEIGEIQNNVRCAFLARSRALHEVLGKVRQLPAVALIDHFFIPDCPISQLGITRGDEHVVTIAAASIVAKVVRDRWIRCLVSVRPELSKYDLCNNKGYRSKKHWSAVKRFGPTRFHRLHMRELRQLVKDEREKSSFGPVS